MKARLLVAVGLVAGFSACKKADSVVLVNVDIDPDVSPVYSLRVAMSNIQSRDSKIYPATASTIAVPSSTSLVIVVPRSRAGLLDLAFDGRDVAGMNVAHGTAQTAIVLGGTATVSVVLAAGASSCGNGIVDSGETCDDGNQFSFDGCDFRCQAEGQLPDGSIPDSSVPDRANRDSLAEGPGDMARMDATSDSIVPLDLPRDPATLQEDAPPLGNDGGPEAALDTRGVVDLLPPQLDAPPTQPDSSTGLPLGQACAAKEDCASGNCADGVCCQSPCTSVCMTCSLATSPGQCVLVAPGQDPRGNCPQDLASTCGRDGTCDGAGGCRLWAAGTICASATCASGTASAARTCNGTGTCRPAVNTSCLPYACSVSACATQCTGNGNCDSNAWCNGSKCQGRTGTGGACTSDQECVVGDSCRTSVSDPSTKVCSQNV